MTYTWQTMEVVCTLKREKKIIFAFKFDYLLKINIFNELSDFRDFI